MKLYIAAGNYASNKEWALKVKHSLRELFNSVEIMEYAHWSTKRELMDLDYETNKLKERIDNKEPFGIFAKSLGAILILKAIKEEKIHPRFLILLGVPINWCYENKIKADDYIQNFPCPTLIIQNDEDPTISSQELKVYLNNKGVRDYFFLEYKNRTHDYDNLIEIKNKIKKFIKDIGFVPLKKS